MIVNEEFAATSPPVGTLNEMVLAVVVIEPIAAPFIVPPEIPLNVNPAGKFMTTAFPAGIAASGSFTVFALKV
jgi:hypothetical protein